MAWMIGIGSKIHAVPAHAVEIRCAVLQTTLQKLLLYLSPSAHSVLVVCP